MKNSTTLLAAALVAAFTTAAAHADTRMIPNGRAGYTLVQKTPDRAMNRNDGRTTNVALVMAKPEESGTKIQIAGRSGYIITRNR